MTEQAAATVPADEPIRRLLSIDEVSEILGLPVTTLRWQKQQKVGVGTIAIKVGRHLKWRPEDLDRWLDEQRGGEA